MKDLTKILNSIQPGCTKAVDRMSTAVEVDGKCDDPWPNADTSAETLQAAINECVTWQDGVTPITGAEVFAALANSRSAKDVAQAKAANNNPLLEQLDAMDAKLPRFMEDLTDTLVANGALVETDLPAEAQELLTTKRALRGGLI